MENARRRAITLPPFYDDMVANYAAERGLGFSPALVMMLEILRNDPRFAKSSLPDRTAAKSAKEEEKPFVHPYPLWFDRKLSGRPRSARNRLHAYVTLKLTDEHIIACERQYMEAWPEAEPPEFDLDNP